MPPPAALAGRNARRAGCLDRLPPAPAFRRPFCYRSCASPFPPAGRRPCRINAWRRRRHLAHRWPALAAWHRVALGAAVCVGPLRLRRCRPRVPTFPAHAAGAALAGLRRLPLGVCSAPGRRPVPGRRRVPPFAAWPRRAVPGAGARRGRPSPPYRRCRLGPPASPAVVAVPPWARLDRPGRLTPRPLCPPPCRPAAVGAALAFARPLRRCRPVPPAPPSPRLRPWATARGSGWVVICARAARLPRARRQPPLPAVPAAAGCGPVAARALRPARCAAAALARRLPAVVAVPPCLLLAALGRPNCPRPGPPAPVPLAVGAHRLALPAAAARCRRFRRPRPSGARCAAFGRPRRRCWCCRCRRAPVPPGAHRHRPAPPRPALRRWSNPVPRRPPPPPRSPSSPHLPPPPPPGPPRQSPAVVPGSRLVPPLGRRCRPGRPYRRPPPAAVVAAGWHSPGAAPAPRCAGTRPHRLPAGTP